MQGGPNWLPSRFICQVWCSGIQSILFLITHGGSSAKVCSSAKISFNTDTDILKLAQYEHVRVEISVIVIWGVFQGCLRHVLGCVEGVTSAITVQC